MTKEKESCYKTSCRTEFCFQRDSHCSTKMVAKLLKMNLKINFLSGKAGIPCARKCLRNIRGR